MLFKVKKRILVPHNHWTYRNAELNSAFKSKCYFYLIIINFIGQKEDLLMKNMRLYGFKNVVNNKYIMYTITTLLLISILTVGVIRNVKADSQHNYNKSFISIEIKEGDTLTSIAKEYSISNNYDQYIDEVRSINNLRNDTIHTGCFLLIPVYNN